MQILNIQYHLCNSQFQSNNSTTNICLQPQLTKDTISFSGINKGVKTVFSDKISQLACETVLAARRGNEEACKKVADAIHLARNPQISRKPYDDVTKTIAHKYQWLALNHYGELLKYNAYDYPQLYRVIDKNEYGKLLRGEHIISPNYNTVFVTNNPNGVAAQTKTKEHYFVTFKLKDDLDLFCKGFLDKKNKRFVYAHNAENAEYCIEEGYTLADVENIRKRNIKGQIVYAEDLDKAVAADKKQKQEIINKLVETTYSGNEKEIRQSLKELGNYPEEFSNVATSVSHLLGNNNPDIHQEVFSVIRQSTDKKNINIVTSYIDTHQIIDDSLLRGTILNCLQKFGKNEHLDYVLKLFGQCDDDIEVFYLSDCFSMLAKPNDIEKILKYKNSPQMEQQSALIQIIGKMNAKEHLSILKEKLHSDNPNIRYNAVEMIGYIGGKADITDIKPCLTDNNSDVRYKATEAIQVLSSK